MYKKDVFKVMEPTVIMNKKVGNRSVTHTVLENYQGQCYLLIGKTDSNGFGKRLAEGEIVTATYTESSMNKLKDHHFFHGEFKAISVQNSTPSEIKDFKNRMPFKPKSIGLIR
jgi:hypothetical protein